MAFVCTKLTKKNIKRRKQSAKLAVLTSRKTWPFLIQLPTFCTSSVRSRNKYKKMKTLTTTTTTTTKTTTSKMRFKSMCCGIGGYCVYKICMNFPIFHVPYDIHILICLGLYWCISMAWWMRNSNQKKSKENKKTKWTAKNKRNQRQLTGHIDQVRKNVKFYLSKV